MMSEAFWQSSQCEVMVDPNVQRNQRGLQEAECIKRWVHGRPEFEGHLFFATSGSTSARGPSSKGGHGGGRWVALSRRAMLASAAAVNRHLKVSHNDRWLLALPTFHVGGAGILARCYLASCAVIRAEGKWSPQSFARLVCEQEVTISSLVPTQLVDLVSGGIEAPLSLRVVLIGGGRLEDDVYERALALNWPVVETYGMTEACSQIATACAGERSLTVLPHWQTCQHQDGRLMIKGDALLSAYVSCSDGAFSVYDPKENGWFVTGDLADLESSCLTVRGRSDRCVKVLGELVDLDELQVMLNGMLGRCEDDHMAVVALPAKRRGVKLVVCTDKVSVQSQLLSVVLDRYHEKCHPLHRIDGVQMMSELPRSPLGKLRYGVIADCMALKKQNRES